MGKFQNLSWNKIFKVDDSTTIEDLKIQYAKLIKEFRPNDYPEEFQEIRSAYKATLNYMSNPTYNIYNHKENGVNSILQTFDFSSGNVKESEAKLRFDFSDIYFYRIIVEVISQAQEYDIKMINSFFMNSDNIYIEVLKFYYITYGLMGKRSYLDLFIYDLRDIWKAFFASRSSRLNTLDYEVFSGIEKQYFTSVRKSEKVNLFIQIINEGGFSYPFNYMREDVFDNLEKSNYEFLKNYVNSIDYRFMVYYDNPRLNLKILEMLPKEKQADYYIYILAGLHHTNLNINSSRELYLKKLENIDGGKLEFLKNTERSVNALENLARVNFSYLLEGSLSDNQNYIYQAKYSKVSNKNRYLSSKIIVLLCVVSFLIGVVVIYSSNKSEYESNLNEINEVRDEYGVDNNSKILDFGMCINMHNLPFEISIESKNENSDGSEKIVINVEGDTSSFDINNLYIGEQNLGEISTTKFVQNDGYITVELLYNESDFSEDANMYYIVSGEESIICSI